MKDVARQIGQVAPDDSGGTSEGPSHPFASAAADHPGRDPRDMDFGRGGLGIPGGNLGPAGGGAGGGGSGGGGGGGGGDRRGGRQSRWQQQQHHHQQQGTGNDYGQGQGQFSGVAGLVMRRQLERSVVCEGLSLAQAWDVLDAIKRLIAADDNKGR